MRIVVNDIAANSGGAMTILRDFYRCVCETDQENEWIFLLGDKYFEETDRVKILTFPQVKSSGLEKLKFDFFKGKKIIGQLCPDVVLSLQNIITFGLKVPQITYVHQSIPFQSDKRFSFFNKREYKLAIYQYIIGSIIKRSIKKADRTIVQTAWMKEAVCRKCKIPEEKVSVIPPNVNDVSAYACDKVFDPTSFFYPTSAPIYKNNDCLFSAADILTSEGYQFTLTVTLSKEKERENVSCVGRIPYAEVFEHYQGGTLVFPSYVESFGYPLVEARAMGTVILASDCSFSHELLDGYENAYFFDPFSPQQLANLMKDVLEGRILKKDVRAQNVEVRNTWTDVINEMTSTVK